MTLYLETANGFTPWAGEAISDVLHPPSIEVHWSDDELAGIGLYRPVPADPIPAFRVMTAEAVQRVDGIVRFVRDVDWMPLDDRKAQMIAALAYRRWQAETGGLTFDAMRIPTDRDTQSRIAEIVGAYKDGDVTGAIEFKMPFGFIPLTGSQLAAIKAAGAQHIQACFKKEADLTAMIEDAADHAALDALDLESGWPGFEG